MKRKALKMFGASAGLATLLVAGLAVTFASAGNPNNSHNKVTICHATGSKTNPYVRITPDASGVVAGHAAHQDQRDIIPPFDYYDSGGTLHHFPGQNWTAEGQAIYANGCKKPTATTPTPTTPTPTVTVTTPGPTQTVTVNVPTPGPTTTVVRRGKGGKVIVVRKTHIKVASTKKPKTTG